MYILAGVAVNEHPLLAAIGQEHVHRGAPAAVPALADSAFALPSACHQLASCIKRSA